MAGIPQQLGFFILKVIYREYDNWPAGEEQVETLIQQVIVQSDTGEEGEVTEAHDGYHEYDVLVKHETYQKTIPSVGLSPVHE